MRRRTRRGRDPQLVGLVGETFGGDLAHRDDALVDIDRHQEGRRLLVLLEHRDELRRPRRGHFAHDFPHHLDRLIHDALDHRPHRPQSGGSTSGRYSRTRTMPTRQAAIMPVMTLSAAPALHALRHVDDLGAGAAARPPAQPALGTSGRCKYSALPVHRRGRPGCAPTPAPAARPGRPARSARRAGAPIAVPRRRSPDRPASARRPARARRHRACRARIPPRTRRLSSSMRHDPRHSRISKRLRRSQVLIVFAGASNCAASWSRLQPL